MSASSQPPHWARSHCGCCSSGSSLQTQRQETVRHQKWKPNQTQVCLFIYNRKRCHPDRRKRTSENKLTRKNYKSWKTNLANSEKRKERSWKSWSLFLRSHLAVCSHPTDSMYMLDLWPPLSLCFQAPLTRSLDEVRNTSRKSWHETQSHLEPTQFKIHELYWSRADV